MIAEHVKKSMAASSGFKSTHTIKVAKVVKEKLDEYHNNIKNTKSYGVDIALGAEPRATEFPNQKCAIPL